MSSFGEELRRERELREISLREVADATKINLRYLEAMERNDFDDLPGGVFNRGFVRAYCQFIGVDSESMVNAYLLEEQARHSPGVSGLLRGRGDASSARIDGASSGAPAAQPRRMPSWGIWLAVAAAVLFVASAIVYLLGGFEREPPPAGADSSGLDRESTQITAPAAGTGGPR